MPIGIRCRKGFDLRAAVRRHHNHRADYRDSIISEKRSGEDEPHGKVRAVEIFAMGRACLDAQIAGVRPVESIDDVVHAVLPGLPDRLKREAIVERVEWLLQDVTDRKWSCIMPHTIAYSRASHPATRSRTEKPLPL